jgi:toxin ParE1/3/4
LPRLRFTTAARRDLDAIYDHGFATFGQATADRMLVTTAQSLLAFPLMGPEVPDRTPPLRRFSAESHVIYYRPDADGILVTRILHSRQMPRLHR